VPLHPPGRHGPLTSARRDEGMGAPCRQGGCVE